MFKSILNTTHMYEEDNDQVLLKEIEDKRYSTKIVDDGLGNNEQEFDRNFGYR